MIEKSTFTFTEMQAANPQGFSALDYLAYLSQEMRLGPDFGGALLQLLQPRFVEIDGKILVEAVGAAKKYKEYRSMGYAPDKAQYWANLTEITNLFGGIAVPQAKLLAAVLQQSWQEALKIGGIKIPQEVKIVEDKFEEEVFITVVDPVV